MFVLAVPRSAWTCTTLGPGVLRKFTLHFATGCGGKGVARCLKYLLRVSGVTGGLLGMVRFIFLVDHSRVEDRLAFLSCSCCW